MKILIIDDEKSVTDFFLNLAQVRGYGDIDTAASGEEALAFVIKNSYDLITLDIRMPGVSGLEIIAMLRNMCPHAIIAIVSGFIPDEVSEEVAGCVDVMIPKPVSLETFHQLLDGAEQILSTIENIRLLGSVPTVVR